MTEGHSNFSEHSEIEGYINRFEEMLKKNDEYFFDSFIFEGITEYYLETNNINHAKRCIEMGLSQHPNSANLLLKKAQMHISTGNLDRGLEYLNKAEAFDPSNEEIFIIRANVFSQKKNYSEAIKNYERALQYSDEDLDEIYLDIAFEYENCEDYENAITYLHRAFNANPKNETVLYELTYCYDLAGRIEECIGFLNDFIDRDPYAHSAWYNLGNSFLKLSFYEKAIIAFDYCIVIKENFTSAYFNKASAFIQLGEYEKAIQCYSDTLDFEPAQALTFNYIAECYEKLERFSLAIEFYKKALDIQPALAQAWIGLGIVHDFMEKYEKSLGYIEKALEISTHNPDYLHIYAEVLEKTTRVDEAKEAYEGSLELDKSVADVWLDFSNFLFKNGEYNEAVFLLEEAKNHTENKEFDYRITAYLLSSGKRKEALLFLDKALQNDFDSHHKLLDYFPDAKYITEVVDMIDMYEK